MNAARLTSPGSGLLFLFVALVVFWEGRSSGKPQVRALANPRGFARPCATPGRIPSSATRGSRRGARRRRRRRPRASLGCARRGMREADNQNLVR